MLEFAQVITSHSSLTSCQTDKKSLADVISEFLVIITHVMKPSVLRVVFLVHIQLLVSIRIY